MKKSYDYRGAEGLIPLLQILNKEIAERTDAIHKSTCRVLLLRNTESDLTPRERRNQEALLQVEIATHRREIAYTRKELSKLGCLVDSEDPSTFLIPGLDGKIEGGYAWRAGDTQVHIHINK